MNIQYEIPWSELLWQGLAEDTGEFIVGQLFKNKDGYYIHRNYRQDDNDDISCITVSDWHKIAPFTLARVEVEEITEEEEQKIIETCKRDVTQEMVEFLQTYEKKYKELIEDYLRNRPWDWI